MRSMKLGQDLIQTIRGIRKPSQRSDIELAVPYSEKEKFLPLPWEFHSFSAFHTPPIA